MDGGQIRLWCAATAPAYSEAACGAAMVVLALLVGCILFSWLVVPMVTEAGKPVTCTCTPGLPVYIDGY